MAGAVAMTWWQAHEAGVSNLYSLRPPFRAGVATTALFAVCGYGPARLLLPARLAPHRLVFTLPVGAACSTLALTVLGLLHVPLSASLPAVLAAGALTAVASLRTGRSPRGPLAARFARGPLAVAGHAAAPLAVAALVCLLGLMPVLRAGYPTVVGQNGDAILAVGTANLLEHAPPTAVRPDLPLDRVPPVWRSKLPIYYGLAGVSRLAGQDPVKTFPTVAAFMLAMAALGVALLLRFGLGAPPAVALAAMFLVALDRIAVHVTIHPYYNQLWGLFALPFILLFTWEFVSAPSRRGAALLALFVALGIFAYPLMLPFPVVFAAVAAWRRRATLRLPRLRARSWVWALAAVPLVPVAAVLGRGVAEKSWEAARAALPGGDLAGWSGAALPYFPFGRFFGIDGVAAVAVPAAVAVLAAAALGLRRGRREVALALGATVAAGLLIAFYFWARDQGQLFYFKSLGFTGPLVVGLAVAGLGGLAAARGAPRIARAAALAALALFVVPLAGGARKEIAGTYEYADRSVLALRDWDRELPPSATIRIDVPPTGYQMWSWYMLSHHRVSASRPLVAFFPHPPFGVRADYILAWVGEPRPPDALGAPVRRSQHFLLYRQRPGESGPDTSTRALIF